MVMPSSSARPIRRTFVIFGVDTTAFDFDFAAAFSTVGAGAAALGAVFFAAAGAGLASAAFLAGAGTFSGSITLAGAFVFLVAVGLAASFLAGAGLVAAFLAAGFGAGLAGSGAFFTGGDFFGAGFAAFFTGLAGGFGAGLAALTAFLGAGLAAAFFAGLAGALGAGFFFAGMAREVGRWFAKIPQTLVQAEKSADSDVLSEKWQPETLAEFFRRLNKDSNLAQNADFTVQPSTCISPIPLGGRLRNTQYFRCFRKG